MHDTNNNEKSPTCLTYYYNNIIERIKYRVVMTYRVLIYTQFIPINDNCFLFIRRLTPRYGYLIMEKGIHENVGNQGCFNVNLIMAFLDLTINDRYYIFDSVHL